MNSGRYLYSVSAEAHGKAAIDKLGWTELTRGPLLHALQPRINSIWPIGKMCDYINAQRRQQWIEEEKVKKEAEEKTRQVQ